MRLVISACVLVLAPAAHAQEWSIEAQAGQIHAASDVAEARADTFLIGARFDDPLTTLRVSTGLPTEATSPWWGALSGSRRITAPPRRGIMYGVDLTGHGFVIRDRAAAADTTAVLQDRNSGYAAAGQVLPGVRLQSGPFQVHGRSGVSQYRSRLGSDARDRTVWLSDVQAVVAPRPSLALVPLARHVRDAERGYTYGGITAMVAHRRASAWGSVGSWVNVPGAGVPWAIGGTARVHPHLAIHLTRRHDTFDPLYLRAPLRSWSVALSWTFKRPAPMSPPVPAAYRDGRATIRLPAGRSRLVPRVAGDFTGWEPQAMTREGDQWLFEAAVAPGVYHYAFVTEADEWFVPERTPGRRDDGMGGHVAVLVVTP